VGLDLGLTAINPEQRSLTSMATAPSASGGPTAIHQSPPVRSETTTANTTQPAAIGPGGAGQIRSGPTRAIAEEGRSSQQVAEQGVDRAAAIGSSSLMATSRAIWRRPARHSVGGSLSTST
jgi:hypothetical protein